MNERSGMVCVRLNPSALSLSSAIDRISVDALPRDDLSQPFVNCLTMFVCRMPMKSIYSFGCSRNFTDVFCRDFCFQCPRL